MGNSIPLGQGSSIEFIQLDGSRIEQEPMLGTIRGYAEKGMWPSDFLVRVYGYRNRNSLGVKLANERIPDPEEIMSLTDGKPTCYVEKQRAIIVLPQDFDTKGARFESHEVTHIPQRLGEKEGGIFQVSITGFPPQTCPRFDLEALSLMSNVLRGVLDDYVSNSLFPGDKSKLIPSPQYCLEQIQLALQYPLPFLDSVITLDVCKERSFNPEGYKWIMDKLELPQHRKEKIEKYSKELDNCMRSSLSGVRFPTRDDYNSALFDMVSIANKYEGFRICKHGQQTTAFIIPAITFKKLDGSKYMIDTLTRERIKVPKDAEPSIAPLLRRMAERIDYPFINSTCF